jgi:hypothetical protein
MLALPRHRGIHMKTLFATTSAVLMLAAAVLASAPAVSATSALSAAQAANVTGEWTFNVTTDQGGGTPTMTFKQEGEKLTGKYVGQLGASDLTGTVKGNEIAFSFTIDAQGQQAPVNYKGTVEKDTMKGSLDIAGMVNGTFTATRKK